MLGFCSSGKICSMTYIKPIKISLYNFPRTPFLKGTLSSLRQFLATENPLQMMKNAFYFTFKALLVLKIFKLLSSIFGHVEKWLA